MTDFERWWYDEGSANRPVDEDIEEFAKRMCQIAWSNGAFVEREAIYDLVMEAPFKEFDRQEEDFDGEAANAMKAMAFSLTAAIRARGKHGI